MVMWINLLYLYCCITEPTVNKKISKHIRLCPYTQYRPSFIEYTIRFNCLFFCWLTLPSECPYLGEELIPSSLVFYFYFFLYSAWCSLITPTKKNFSHFFFFSSKKRKITNKINIYYIQVQNRTIEMIPSPPLVAPSSAGSLSTLCI